ncbi:MAG: hypothetical protein J6T86_03225 [Bacteroidales bacterium]|nr:hypothetical protein [Bacteroidales bacterium]MBO7647428.1 hypothetical protein [Bacteroidales bacterium]
MKKYTNKILIITFAILALLMVVFLTINIQKAKKWMRENPDKCQKYEPRVDDPQNTITITTDEDTVVITDGKVKESL